MVEAIAAQDNLFSVSTLSAAGSATRVVGALSGVRHAPRDPDAVVALLADPAVRVVTLTVTEKAYQLDPVTGELSPDAALAADLAGGRPPTTVPGLLLRGLAARAAADAGPVALVSCDNLPANGRRLRGMLDQAVGRADGVPAGLVEWVAANVTCPGTMVDRIVPASTPETIEAARRVLGVTDLAAVAAEPYAQWVIEDDFPGGRPGWEHAGAVLTDDAGPWERLKLRTLNGVHSAIAYLGALAGRETIAEALEIPHLADVLRRLIAEDVAASFTPPEGSGWSTTASRSSPGSATRQSTTAPSRSRWTARRSCRNASCTPSPTCARPAGPRAGARWSWRPGCASRWGTPTTGTRCRSRTPWPGRSAPRWTPVRRARRVPSTRSSRCATSSRSR